ncbi:GNAT family N-acetyltransferase [Paracoccus tegillarcae]|uniref:N-acetyltransferase domain-containing protein n=1 Tax=Paracoccus tegillarcae TaxID=1529068 RepID=A0A2K9EWR0_9RHOB|nr:GNAT family N-acetyltransferase [Paracoccus tegillarcae]AUH32492.1 hypothetical protein CUV01_03005 [Paracoccus tegillarcae]
MNYVFRLAVPSDAEACSQIIQDWGDETPWMVPLDNLAPMKEFWSFIFEEEIGWVAHRNGQILGFCARTEDNITGLYVAKKARGKGLGKALLDLAKEDQQWITVWAYEKNEDARRFYRREGLIEIGREMEVFEDGSSLMDIEHRWTRAE